MALPRTRLCQREPQGLKHSRVEEDVGRVLAPFRKIEVCPKAHFGGNPGLVAPHSTNHFRDFFYRLR